MAAQLSICRLEAGTLKSRRDSPVESEPPYLMFSVPSLLLGIAYERLVNRYSSLSEIRTCLFGSFHKPI